MFGDGGRPIVYNLQCSVIDTVPKIAATIKAVVIVCCWLLSEHTVTPLAVELV